MIAKQKFSPQDYCGLPLAVALDRLAEQAGVIDCEPERLEGGFVLHPDEGRRWVRLFFRRFIEQPDAGHGRRPPLGALLTGDAYDAGQREIAPRNNADAAFVCAVGPLIEALKSGQIVAHGFGRGARKLEPIDPALWHMSWFIKRRDNTAVLEFFADTAKVELYTDTTRKNAEVVELVGVMLAAPESVRSAPQAEARRAADASCEIEAPAKKPKGKSGRKEIDDRKNLECLRDIINAKANAGRFKFLTEAVADLTSQRKVEGQSKRAIYERLRGKLGKHWDIQEGEQGLKLIPREAVCAI